VLVFHFSEKLGDGSGGGRVSEAGRARLYVSVRRADLALLGRRQATPFCVRISTLTNNGLSQKKGYISEEL